MKSSSKSARHRERQARQGMQATGVTHTHRQQVALRHCSLCRRPVAARTALPPASTSGAADRTACAATSSRGAVRPLPSGSSGSGGSDGCCVGGGRSEGEWRREAWVQLTTAGAAQCPVASGVSGFLDRMNRCTLRQRQRDSVTVVARAAVRLLCAVIPSPSFGCGCRLSCEEFAGSESRERKLLMIRRSCAARLRRALLLHASLCACACALAAAALALAPLGRQPSSRFPLFSLYHTHTHTHTHYALASLSLSFILSLRFLTHRCHSSLSCVRLFSPQHIERHTH